MNNIESFGNEIKHVYNLNTYSVRCHIANRDWWVDPETKQPIKRNKGELIALMHSELSEALEGMRKNSMDDKIPYRLQEEVELADLLIRLFDYAGGFGLDLNGAFEDKMEYNANRADHKLENRAKKDGKKF